jgi:hypothetical protein
MLMGQPGDVNDQVTFIWLEHDQYQSEDSADNPYSWTQAPTAVTSSAKTVVQVNCAVDYTSGTVTADSAGQFAADKAVLTLLDVDYASVAGADQVRLGGHLYAIDSPGATPIGLFDVTVWQISVSLL